MLRDTEDKSARIASTSALRSASDAVIFSSIEDTRSVRLAMATWLAAACAWNAAKKFMKYAGAPVRSTLGKSGVDITAGEDEVDATEVRDSVEPGLPLKFSSRVYFRAGSSEGDGGEIKRFAEVLAGMTGEV